MSASMVRRDDRKGSVLAVVLVAVVALAGLIGALSTVSVSYSKASASSSDREAAYQAAQSGVAYYLARLGLNENYFTATPAPHAPQSVGAGTFRLVSATLSSPGVYNVVIEGGEDDSVYRLAAAIGREPVKLPPGISVTGTGNKSTQVFTTSSGAKIGSYDPDYGAYNPSSPGDNVQITVNGTAKLTGTNIYGDITAQGNVNTSSSTITGTVTANAPPEDFDDIDPLVNQLMASSKITNNNAVLAGIFGTKWIPVASTQNYGDLIVNGGTYTVPPGTYRFRKLEIKGGATVTFNTIGGPTTICYVGSGAGTGTGNDLTVASGSKLLVNNGTTSNGLMTVLGIDCDFNVATGGVFGQSTTDPNNAGYTQVISLGGNASSDNFTVAGTVYARLYAAAHAVSVTGKMYGSALARTVTIGTNGLFAFDEGYLGTTLPANSDEVTVMATWPGGYEVAP